MKTQDLLLLGIGVGIGYLAFKRYQQNKPKPDNTQHPLEVGTANAPKTQAQCEAEWNEKASTMKISQSALATAKANFMLTCTPVITATI
jgi:uncharacterized membrane protein YebE (DUF533 family)